LERMEKIKIRRAQDIERKLKQAKES